MRLTVITIICAGIAALSWKYVLPHKHLASEGTFFLLQRATKPTEFGVYSLGPGSEVHRIAQQGSTLTVSDGQQQFEVDASQLTNDLDIGADLQRAQGEERRRVHSAIEQEKRRIQNLQRETQIDHAKATDESEKARRETVRAPSALDRGAYDQKEDVARGPSFIYHHQVDRGGSNQKGQSTGQWQYTDKFGNRFWIDRNGGKHYVPPR